MKALIAAVVITSLAGCAGTGMHGHSSGSSGMDMHGSSSGSSSMDMHGQSSSGANMGTRSGGVGDDYNATQDVFHSWVGS